MSVGLEKAFASGGIYSTVEDMHTVGTSVVRRTLLSRALIDRMLTVNLGPYGYGWNTGTSWESYPFPTTAGV